MPGLVPIPFWTETAEARSPHISAARLRNWYLEKSPDGAKSPVALYPTPGLSLVDTVGSGPIRGMLRAHGGVADVSGELLWVVSGTELYYIFSSAGGGNPISYRMNGEIGGAGAVRMIGNGTEVVICTQEHAYVVKNNAVLEIAEPYSGDGAAYFTGAAYQDGYGLYTQMGNDFLWWSDLDDLTSITATNYTNADAFPGNTVGLVSDHREVWVFCRDAIEIFYNDGSTPFVRSQAGFIERGCLSAGSICKEKNAVFWLGDDFNVYMASGYQPQSISPPWIVRAIESQPSAQTSEAFVYSQDGHTFYVLTFSGLTLVFDMTTGRWHERVSQGCGGRWRASCHQHMWGIEVVGDYSNGNIYKLDLDAYDEEGETIRREAISPPIHGGGDRVTMHELFIDMEGGPGTVSGSGADPDLMLDWSDDGGRHWSNERHLKLGDLGEYETQVRTYRLGQFRQRQIRIAISDPVKAVVAGAWARLEGAAI